MSRFQELTRRAAVRALGSAGWQPILRRIRIGVHAESVKSRQRTRSVDHMLRVNSEFLHYFRSGCAETETVQSDYFSIEADILIPNFRHACLNRHTFAEFLRQNFFAIFLRFAIESFHAWHRNDARARAQFLHGSERVLQFASTRHN